MREVRLGQAPRGRVVSALSPVPTQARGNRLGVCARGGGAPPRDDPRQQFVRDAVTFWNERLAEAGSGFRIGGVRCAALEVPEQAFRALGDSVLVAPAKPLAARLVCRPDGARWQASSIQGTPRPMSIARLVGAMLLEHNDERV